jgi:hypothetical protein
MGVIHKLSPFSARLLSENFISVIIIAISISFEYYKTDEIFSQLSCGKWVNL